MGKKYLFLRKKCTQYQKSVHNSLFPHYHITQFATLPHYPHYLFVHITTLPLFWRKGGRGSIKEKKEPCTFLCRPPKHLKYTMKNYLTISRGSNRIRTCDPLLVRQVL